MNLLDFVITKIIDRYTEELKEKYRDVFTEGKAYVVKYEYDCYGVLSTTERWFPTEEKALEYKVGYKGVC